MKLVFMFIIVVSKWQTCAYFRSYSFMFNYSSCILFLPLLSTTFFMHIYTPLFPQFLLTFLYLSLPHSSPFSPSFSNFLPYSTFALLHPSLPPSSPLPSLPFSSLPLSFTTLCSFCFVLFPLLLSILILSSSTSKDHPWEPLGQWILCGWVAAAVLQQSRGGDQTSDVLLQDCYTCQVGVAL